MKRNFLVFILACLLPISLMAQYRLTTNVDGKNNLRFGYLNHEVNVMENDHIKPGANETWWGYFDGDLSNAKGIGVGDYSEPGMTYDCAIFIPGNHSMGEGRIIKALRIYFASAQNMTNIKVWMSKKLPNTADEADIQVKNVNFNDITDGAVYDDPENDIAFDKPYTIDKDGVYVGYSFTMDAIESMQDMLPVVVSLRPSVTEQNANFISTGWGWEDCSGKEGMGNLALRVLMEGDFKNDVVEAASDFEDIYCVKNETAEIPLNLVNMGGNGLDNFSYVVSIDGVKSEEKVMNLGTHVEGIGTKFECSVPLQMDENTSIKQVEIEITKVGGNKNETENSIVRGCVVCLSELVTRKVVIEEYTGTWAEWAPRSYVGLEKAAKFYGDEIVITSNHFGEDDPMKCDAYKELQPEYAPECNVSREMFGVDTYYGTYINEVWGMQEIIDKLRKTAPVAKIKAEGIISNDGSKVTASSFTTFLYDGDKADYSIAYVLKTSGLKGDSEEWYQKNVLSQFKDGHFDFDPLFAKWVDNDFEVKDMVYNDVPVAAVGIKNGVGGSVQLPVVAGEAQKYSVEFDLNEIGGKIQDKEQLYVCVYLIDNVKGNILNADCQKVTDEAHSSIIDIESDEEESIVARYSVDGTKLEHPVSGVNIVKYSDGRVIKVVVR